MPLETVKCATLCDDVTPRRLLLVMSHRLHSAAISELLQTVTSQVMKTASESPKKLKASFSHSKIFWSLVSVTLTVPSALLGQLWDKIVSDRFVTLSSGL